MIKVEIEKALDLITKVLDNHQFREQLLKAAIKAGRLYRQTRGALSLKP